MFSIMSKSSVNLFRMSLIRKGNYTMASSLLQPTPKLIGILNVAIIKGEQKKGEETGAASIE